MKKIDLTGWSAIAEIVGTVAIVVSLLFVGYSVNRNTVVMQATNENLISQRTEDIIRDVLSNSDILSIAVKKANDEELSTYEKVGMELFVQRRFNQWELAYYRYSEGLFPPERWDAFNSATSQSFMGGQPFACNEDCWANKKSNFGTEFVKHVDAEYAKK